MIAIVAAMTEKRVIGNDGKIPWKIPGEQARFRDLTYGHTVIMGRKTFESIGKALPGRRNIVVTRNAWYQADGCTIAETLGEAIAIATGDIFLIGGAQIYEEGLGFADKIFLTVIHETYEGDTYFPKFSKQNWEVYDRKHVSVRYTFLAYRRKK